MTILKEEIPCKSLPETGVEQVSVSFIFHLGPLLCPAQSLGPGKKGWCYGMVVRAEEILS
jgi:hypothetical protein